MNSDTAPRGVIQPLSSSDHHCQAIHGDSADRRFIEHKGQDGMHVEVFPDDPLHGWQVVAAFCDEVVQEEHLVPAFELGEYGIPHGQGPDPASRPRNQPQAAEIAHGFYRNQLIFQVNSILSFLPTPCALVCCLESDRDKLFNSRMIHSITDCYQALGCPFRPQNGHCKILMPRDPIIKPPD